MNRTRGFTLVETALATAIIGTGVIALMQLMAVGTMANRESTDLTTGMNLARNVREKAMTLAFGDPVSPATWGLDSGESASSPSTIDDVNDLHGQTFKPPIDSRGQSLPDFADWMQSVKVECVDPANLTAVRQNGSTKADRVTVYVSRGGNQVCQLTWFQFDGKP